MKKIIIAILIFICFRAFAFEVNISPDKVFPGDKVSVTVRNCKKLNNIIETDNKSFVIQNNIQEDNDTKLEIIPFDFGKFNIKFNCGSKDSQFNFNVKERLKDNISEIADIKNIVNIKTKNNIVLPVIIITLILLLILISYVFYKKKKKSNRIKPVSFEEQFIKLKNQKDNLNSYFENLILFYKKLQGNVLNIDFTGKTTDEIIKLNNNENRDEFIEILKQADLIKFSGKKPSIEIVEKIEKKIEELLKEIGEKNV